MPDDVIAVAVPRGENLGLGESSPINDDDSRAGGVVAIAQPRSCIARTQLGDLVA